MAFSPPNQQQQSHDQSNKSTPPPPQIQSTTLVLTTPFSNFFKPNTNNNNILHNLHNSFVSSKHHFFSFFNSFISHNPLLNTLSSLSSQLHQTSHQIQCGRVRNVNMLASKNFAAILPGDSVAGLVVTNGIMNFLNLYNTVLVVRLVLTWFPNTPPAIVTPLSTLCDPYLNIFRGVIPPLGGTLDLSPILAFLVLNAFTSAAAALPCELPPPGGLERNLSSPKGLTDITTSQKLWMRRLCRKQPKSSKDAK